MATLDEITKEIQGEVQYAITMYPKFASAHEGASVLREEFEELWDEVKIKQGKRDRIAMRKEAVQVAAMAIRFIYDLTQTEEEAQR